MERLGTGARGDFRQPTASRKNQNIGAHQESVGYNTTVNIQNRPITNHGVGLKMKGLGGARVYYDKTYYLTKLKEKNQELSKEIDKLKQEADDINRDNNLFMQLQRKEETLIKDVRKLEGELADYNLALDKQRAGAHADDIMALFHHMQNQNERQKAQLDEIFIERKKLEEEIGELENELEMINQANEEKLNELDPDQRRDYENLKQENKSIIEHIHNIRKNLEKVNARLTTLEAQLKADHLKQKAQNLREERGMLARKKEELELQTNEKNLPFPEARERLMKRAREDRDEIQHLEQRTSDMKSRIESLKKQIREHENDLLDRKKNEADQDTHKVMQQKEKEIDDFMANFESTMQQTEEDIKKEEEVIEALLEHISKTMRISKNLGTRTDLDAVTDQIADTETRNEDAERTLARVRVELEERKKDLDKINGLEQKIQKEMKQTTEKLEVMQSEIATKYANQDVVRKEYEVARTRLVKKRSLLMDLKDALALLSDEYQLKAETKRAKLLQSEIFKSLNEKELQMMQNEQGIYNMKQYIESKSLETNYKHTLQQCLQVVQKLNQEIIKVTLTV